MIKRRNIMKILDFVHGFKSKKVMNTKLEPDAVSKYIRKELEVKEYIPFREKRMVAEMIVTQNIKEIDGIKKYDNIDGYIGFVVASIAAHTNIEFSSDPVADYDLLAESGLLPQIVAEFQESHNEIDILLKMALASELEDNNPGALIGRFLDGILKKLDGAAGVINGFIGNLDLKEIFSEENVAKIVGLLNK
jgi:hypothetical protein